MLITDTYEGTPCKRAGHTTRYVICRSCVQCKHEDNYTPEAIAGRARYRKTPECQAIVRDAMARYVKTEKGKATKARGLAKQTANRLAAKLAKLHQVD
jgi:hypothetical protein